MRFPDQSINLSFHNFEGKSKTHVCHDLRHVLHMPSKNTITYLIPGVRVGSPVSSQFLGQRWRSGGNLGVESGAEESVVARIGELGCLYGVPSVRVNCKVQIRFSLDSIYYCYWRYCGH